MGRPAKYPLELRNQRTYAKICRDKYLKQGLCPLCGKSRAERSKRYCEKHLKDARDRMRVKLGFKRGNKAIRNLKQEPLLSKNWNEAKDFIQNNLDIFLDKHDPILDKAVTYIDELGVKNESLSELEFDVDNLPSQDWMD